MSNMISINLKLYKIIEKFIELRNKYRGSVVSVWYGDVDQFNDLLRSEDNSQYVNEIMILRDSLIKFSEEFLDENDKRIKREVLSLISKEIDRLEIDMDVNDILNYLMICIFRLEYSESKNLKQKMNKIIEYHLSYILSKENIIISKKSKFLLKQMKLFFRKHNNFKLEDLSTRCYELPMSDVNSSNKIKQKNQKIYFDVEEKIRESLVKLNSLEPLVKLQNDTNIHEYFKQKLNSDKISLKIIEVEGIFTKFISDVGVFSKFFLDSEKPVLFVNKNYSMNKKLSIPQLNLLYIHEIYPGHLTHVQNAMLGKLNFIVKAGISKECLEGWALFSEYVYASDKIDEKFLFQLHLLRRMMSVYLKQFGKLKTEKLIIESGVSESIKKYIVSSINSKGNYEDYLNGFFKILEYSKANSRVIENIQKYGPLEIEFLNSLEEDSND